MKRCSLTPLKALVGAVCSLLLVTVVGCGGGGGAGGGGGNGGGGNDGGSGVPVTPQSAKDMVQVVRDATISARRAGFDMQDILHSAVDTGEALDRQLDLTRGFTHRLEHLLHIIVSLEGEPPGEYEYRWINPYAYGRLYRLSSEQQGTLWRVELASEFYGQPIQFTIQSQNPLRALLLTPTAGSYSISATAYNLNYQAQLQITTTSTRQFSFRLQNVNLSDPALSGTIRFSGEGTAKAAEDPSADQRIALNEMTLTGTIDSPYGDMRVQSLKMIWEPHWNEENSLRRLQAESINFSPAARPTTVQVRGLNAQMKRLPSGELVPVTLAATQTVVETSLTDRAELSNVQVGFVDYPSASDPQDAALSTLSAQIQLRGVRGSYSGQVSVRWQNPRPDIEFVGDRLETFPKGEITFDGQFTPAVGISPVQVQDLRTVFAPDAAPPAITITATMRQGDKTIRAEWQSRLVQMATVEVASSTVRAEYQPSGAVLQATVTGNTVRGSITAPNGNILAQIGKARDLELPDLGDAVIIKYADNKFETLESLWLGM